MSKLSAKQVRTLELLNVIPRTPHGLATHLDTTPQGAVRTIASLCRQQLATRHKTDRSQVFYRITETGRAALTKPAS